MSETASTNDAHGGGRPPAASARILVIEDDHALSEILCDELRARRHMAARPQLVAQDLRKRVVVLDDEDSRRSCRRPSASVRVVCRGCFRHSRTLLSRMASISYEVLTRGTSGLAMNREQQRDPCPLAERAVHADLA